MKEKITKPQAKPTVDREAVRVIELGAREAARRLGLKEGTVLSWASRYKWNLPSQRNVGRPAISAIELQSKPGDVLIAEHQRLEGQTRTGLSKAAATAAEHAGEMQGNEVLSKSNKLRDITHVASKVFGWDKKNKPDLQVNQLVLTPDAGEALREMNALLEEGGDISKERWEKLQNRIHAGRAGSIVPPELLEQMRALCDNPLKKPAISEGEAITATATEKLGHDSIRVSNKEPADAPRLIRQPVNDGET